MNKKLEDLLSTAPINIKDIPFLKDLTRELIRAGYSESFPSFFDQESFLSLFNTIPSLVLRLNEAHHNEQGYVYKFIFMNLTTIPETEDFSFHGISTEDYFTHIDHPTRYYDLAIDKTNFDYPNLDFIEIHESLDQIYMHISALFKSSTNRWSVQRQCFRTPKQNFLDNFSHFVDFLRHTMDVQKNHNFFKSENTQKLY